MAEDLQCLAVAAGFSGFFFVLHLIRTYVKAKREPVETGNVVPLVRYRKSNLSFLETKYKKFPSSGKLNGIEFAPESTGKTRPVVQNKTAQEDTLSPKLQKN